MNKILKFIKIFCKAIVNLVNHDGVEHAGYMSFLFILSIFPFLVFFVSISGFIGESEIGIKFLSFMAENMPASAISALKPRIEEIASGPPEGLLTIAIIGAIWTSSSSVEGMRTILNRVHCVNNLPPYLFRRCLSMLQFIFMTVILILGMFVIILWPILQASLPDFAKYIDNLSNFWIYLKNISVFLTLFLIVSTSYYYIPNTKISFVKIIPGAILVVIGWMASADLLSLYLGHFQQLSIIYGSLGGIIISLLFFYIISLIFIFGAEFNHLMSVKK